MNIQAQALSVGRPLHPPLNPSFHLISHHLARFSRFRTRGLRDSSVICCSSWLGCPVLPLPSRLARRAASTSGAIITPVCKAPSINEDGFESQVLNSDCPVLVDFWATWCGPCKLVAPIMDWAAAEYAGTLKVFKIDVDSNPNLVEKFKVYGLPTLVLFKDGKEVPGSRREGAINKKKFKILLDELLSSVAAT